MDPRISFLPTTISGMHLGSCREQPSPQQVRPNLLLMGKIPRQSSLGRKPRSWNLKRTLYWMEKIWSWQINPVRSDRKLNTRKEGLKCLLGIYLCATYFTKIWVRYCILASLQGALEVSWSFDRGGKNPRILYQNPFQCTSWCPQKCLVLSQLGTAGCSMPGAVAGLTCRCRVGLRCGGLPNAWMEGKPGKRVGKEDFCFSSHDFLISSGGALRRDENRMAARKLVRKPAVG